MIGMRRDVYGRCQQGVRNMGCPCRDAVRGLVAARMNRFTTSEERHSSFGDVQYRIFDTHHSLSIGKSKVSVSSRTAFAPKAPCRPSRKAKKPASCLTRGLSPTRGQCIVLALDRTPSRALNPRDHIVCSLAFLDQICRCIAPTSVFARAPQQCRARIPNSPRVPTSYSVTTSSSASSRHHVRLPPRFARRSSARRATHMIMPIQRIHNNPPHGIHLDLITPLLQRIPQLHTRGRAVGAGHPVEEGIVVDDCVAW